MKELSLNILDISMNSVKAGAENIDICISEEGDKLTLTISDDGCGMDETQLASVTDPFFTTRTTRKVGMGIPLLKLAAEQTGGSVSIISQKGENHGTTLTAVFYTDHIDFTPIGDIPATVTTLIQGSPKIHWHFVHTRGSDSVEIDTNEIAEILGGVPIESFEVIQWIDGYLREGYSQLGEQ